MAEGGPGDYSTNDIELQDLQRQLDDDREEEKTTTFINQPQTNAQVHTEDQLYLTDPSLYDEQLKEKVNKFYKYNERYGGRIPSNLKSFEIKRDGKLYYKIFAGADDVLLWKKSADVPVLLETIMKRFKDENQEQLGKAFIDELGFHKYDVERKKYREKQWKKE